MVACLCVGLLWLFWSVFDYILIKKEKEKDLFNGGGMFSFTWFWFPRLVSISSALVDVCVWFRVC